MQYPLVTIITPSFNRATFLGETIKSVLSQEYPHLEYIVIDDGSTDTTEEIVKTFARKKYRGKKLIYVKQENMGETRSVNKGLLLAHGEIIAVVNSDDPLLAHCIEEIVSYMQHNPRYLAVYPDWEMIDEKGRVVEQVQVSDYNYIKMLSEHYCMPGPATFFRKEAITFTGGRDTKYRYIGDFAFWLKLGMYGQFYHLPKVLATFRVHPGSQGVYGQGKEMAKEHVRLVEEIFGDKDLPSEARKIKRKAYAAAYYQAALKSGDKLSSWKYYLMALVDPITIFSKIRYEGVKLRRNLHEKFLNSTF